MMNLLHAEGSKKSNLLQVEHKGRANSSPKVFVTSAPVVSFELTMLNSLHKCQGRPLTNLRITSLCCRQFCHNVQCIVHCALCVVHCARCIVQCALCIVHCALCTVHCALCAVHYALCTVQSGGKSATIYRFSKCCLFWQSAHHRITTCVIITYIQLSPKICHLKIIVTQVSKHHNYQLPTNDKPKKYI